ncbi:phosphoadenosine phosphosulfate reductase family protein [Priestia megaterium]|uniref:phosphoadenosine phosphosulfate reductase domain-containing protein n=1 Tax=Priestia megaterium TaxID=1404 RepID=UPI002E21ED99|nr:phosphoadenosine phosphosulfate reductase family protein [Priestia megaterium]MED4285076.1 phosphoadenosine phosphosulfate reductase family protein [Priestia megaterium]
MAIMKTEVGQTTLFVNVLSLKKYDKIIVSMSGGKDSLACLLHLLELGVSRRKIELVHQCVDGGPDDEEFMDWPVTEAYCKAISKYFGIPIYFQWRKGGILGEIMRSDSLTNDVYFEQKVKRSKKVVKLETTRGAKATRLKFPAMKADLRTRWCSSSAKIDPFRRALNNNPDYVGKKILVITGERREESSNRAKYEEVELHQCNSGKKLVHSWRPVIDWKEEKVWDIIKRWKIQPHPSYMLGWSRMSCFGCIFSSPNHWAMMRQIAPERFEKLVDLEKEINHTIDNKLTLEEKAKKGNLDLLPAGEELKYWTKIAMGKVFSVEDIIVQDWKLPIGAFRGSAGGPT